MVPQRVHRLPFKTSLNAHYIIRTASRKQLSTTVRSASDGSDPSRAPPKVSDVPPEDTTPPAIGKDENGNSGPAIASTGKNGNGKPVSIPAIPPTRPAPPKGAPQPKSAALVSVDPESMPDGFQARRLLCFSGIVLGYMGLYFTRGSLTYSAPALVADPTMNVTLKDIGAMTSAFPLAYGISKFVGGVMGAKISPTLMLGGGLAVTGLLNIGAAAPGVGVMALTALWAANGCLQGIGAPASAALLTRWFASRERGTWWGLWNIGANVGGFITPLTVGFIAKAYGWRYGMIVPGIAALVLAVYTLNVVRDSPALAGYGNAEEEASLAKPKPTADGTPAENTVWKALKEVLVNPGCWLLAFTYFFVYVVRQGATSWLVFYLMAAKGAPDAGAAARTVSGLELGGLVGGSLAGILSDMRIKSAGGQTNAGHVGRRVQIIMGYVLATFGVLAALRVVPAGAVWLQWITIAALGFCIYGPQMLIGLCGAELVEKPAVGASQGLLGLVAYMGAANAGIPLSWVVSKYGWDGYFVALALACAAAFALLVPLINAKSRLQLREAAPA